jgi:hypothetical protein
MAGVGELYIPLEDGPNAGGLSALHIRKSVRRCAARRLPYGLELASLHASPSAHLRRALGVSMVRPTRPLVLAEVSNSMNMRQM